jgi:glutaredoxin
MMHMINLNILNDTDVNTWIVYSKSNCVFCHKVKELLENEPIITIINCDNWLKHKEKKEIFLDSMKDIIGYEYRTFPMVFLNGKFIGGYTETKNFFDIKLNCELIIQEDF